MAPTGRPGRPRSEESREAVLKAATELMLEVGPRRMTVDQIALRSGVSRATIYRLIALNKLNTVKVGARRLVPLGAIEALSSAGAE